MFSSDQKFLVNGDQKDLLVEVVSCALLIHESLKHKTIKGVTAVSSFFIKSAVKPPPLGVGI